MKRQCHSKTKVINAKTPVLRPGLLAPDITLGAFVRARSSPADLARSISRVFIVPILSSEDNLTDTIVRAKTSSQHPGDSQQQIAYLIINQVCFHNSLHAHDVYRKVDTSRECRDSIHR